MIPPRRPYQETLAWLVDLLDSVVQDQVGPALAETMQRIRRLALERRAGLPEAEPRLALELQRLDLRQLRSVIRWLSLYFDLANLVEDLERVRVLGERDARARAVGVPRTESIAAAIHELKEKGCSASELQGWLNRLHIEPVFTAHPSEAKRRTTRQLLRRIRQHLAEAARPDVAGLAQELLADMTVLWQSDLVRPERPPVMSEVSRGVFFAASLWDVVPQIYRELREALSQAFPHHAFDVPSFIKFGTWIGGDRDGHPFVTAEVTRKALARSRRAGLENHLARCRDMLGRLVMSDLQVPSARELREQTTAAATEWPEFARRLEALSESETYRRFLKMMEFRLEHTLASVVNEGPSGARYQQAEQFLSDLRSLKTSIEANRGQRISDELIQPWIDQFETFGFHFAALDVRQNSDVHRQCLVELLKQMDAVPTEINTQTFETAFCRFDEQFSIDLESLSAESAETFGTFLMIADEVAQWGLSVFGGYIISMTHSAADVLTVLWLWEAAWRKRNGEEAPPRLPIIPLFETIDDLQRAATILDTLFNIGRYRDYLVGTMEADQTVMVGYSDSTKDGGYLSACWELYQAQQKLADIADRHHVALTVFHGRGGALGRGGGPAARAIRSLPARAVGGRLRVTEQGEVLAERYDDPRIAHRHLEQVINATMLVSAQRDADPNPKWTEAMTSMSASSLAKYRNLVQHPDFLAYFERATPIGAIESLPIGSRPARRGQRESLSDLRAIPWTFAWTQSRHLLPAWFGFGTAVREYIDVHDQDWTLLRTMYEQWPMFRALVDNAELALAKADMQIAHDYAQLVPGAGAEEIWEDISQEFDRSRGAVLIITDSHELLSGTEWLNCSIQSRNPYVDPLNLAQVDLLRRQRDTDDEQLKDLLRLTIQGIASGLRTTG